MSISSPPSSTLPAVLRFHARFRCGLHRLPEFDQPGSPHGPRPKAGIRSQKGRPCWRFATDSERSTGMHVLAIIGLVVLLLLILALRSYVVGGVLGRSRSRNR